MQPLIILTGPTAVGKTALSLSLARRLNGEIISADSVQVYRGMDIGSAKIRPEEMQGIPHHLIDVLDPDEPFDVVRFQQMARASIREIASRGKIPIVTGGTGFYIQALLKDVSFEEEDDSADYRILLERMAAAGEGAVLYEKLRQVDPVSAESIHPNNHKRVIRALEFYEKNGYPISQHNAAQRERFSPYRYCYFVLTMPRAELYARIDRRVDEMMEDGLLDEVRTLRERGYGPDLSSMHAIGYRELQAYLDGACPLEEAVRLIRRNTRHFAKRQMTWLRRERDTIILDKSDYGSEEEILEEMLEHCRKSHIV